MDSNEKSTPHTMRIKKYDFKDENIILDFHEFEECKFENCKMIYYGHGPLGLTSCEFLNCQWEFFGPASNTLSFMAQMYKNGKGGDKIVETTFDNIMRGTYL